jgi:hypothetical protein
VGSYLLSGLLFFLAAVILVGSLVLSVFEYRAPGFIRALVRYATHLLLRRGDRPREYDVGDGDRLEGRPFCPCGCDANDDLPEQIVESAYEPHRELPTFRHVIRTRCAHPGEGDYTVHCHDVRELRAWERNWFVYGVLALVRHRLSAKSCPEYVVGVLADHLHPVPGSVAHNVYFADGIGTDARGASSQRQHIEAFFGGGYDVRLLHSRPSVSPAPMRLHHDYLWGIANSPATKPLRSQQALAAFAILNDGFRRKADVAFVGASSGTLQVAMAVRAFLTEPAHRDYLREKVRVINAASMVHRSSHTDLGGELLQFEPHVDRQDALARAFTGDVYTFDDGQTFDLGGPTWRDEINLALWAKVAMESRIHDDVDRYHSIANNYFRTEPWRAAGEKADRRVRHDVTVAFAPERERAVLSPFVPEDRRGTERTVDRAPEASAPTITPKAAPGSAKGPRASKPRKASAD